MIRSPLSRLWFIVFIYTLMSSTINPFPNRNLNRTEFFLLHRIRSIYESYFKEFGPHIYPFGPGIFPLLGT